MAFTSLGVVLVSTMTFVLGTFPEFQPQEESNKPEVYPEAVFVMKIIDNIAVGFFLVEYMVSNLDTCYLLYVVPWLKLIYVRQALAFKEDYYLMLVSLRPSM